MIVSFRGSHLVLRPVRMAMSARWLMASDCTADSMSLAGLDGTLSRCLEDGPLQGKAHLKTGSLDHVTAIAGYLQARSGRRFTIVVLQNYDDVHRGPGAEVQEALLRWLYEQ